MPQKLPDTYIIYNERMTIFASGRKEFTIISTILADKAIFYINLHTTYKTMDKKLVIIPTYNEKENAEKIIRAVTALEEGYDVLIIDDGSPDGTAAIVKGLQQEAALEGRLHLLERPGKLGLGTAYITGFKWALERGYDYVFEMDADFSHDPADLGRLLEACTKDGGDMSVGSRYCHGVNVVNWPMKRVLMSWGASRYVRFVLNVPINDTTAGFVCYSRKVLQSIDLDKVQMKGYGFQIEMKYTAWKLGFKVKEVSVIFRDRTEGNSKMSSGIFGEAFWGVIKLRFRSFSKA